MSKQSQTLNVPLVSVIIVNHNTQQLLQQCLDNLKNSYSNLEIILVDNGSTDGSVNFVKQNFPWVNLIESSNLGLSVAGNKGYFASKGKYLLYLGTDAFPHANCIQGLVDYMENNTDVGISTAKLLLQNGQLDMDAHRGFPTAFTSFAHFSKLGKLFPQSKIFNYYFLGHLNLSTPHEIDLCISHFMFIRRIALEQVNLWDEEFFVFGEDVDLCYRIKAAGYKIMWLPQFTATHLKGVGVGRAVSAAVSKATPQTKLFAKKLSVNAMRLFYKKHFSKNYNFVTNKLVFGGINILELFRTKDFKGFIKNIFKNNE